MNAGRNRTLAILALISLLVGGGFFLYQNLYQKLTIVYGPQVTGVKTTVYRHDHDDDRPPGQDEIVAETTTGTTLRLRKGGYVIQNPRTTTYAQSEQAATLRTSPVTVTIDPEYSDQKVAELLKTESVDIRKQLSVEYPALETFYTIEKEMLIDKGQWYGAILRPRSIVSEESKDVLRVVAQKQKSGWLIISSPPDIIISRAVYPAVPKDVAKTINKLTVD